MASSSAIDLSVIIFAYNHEAYIEQTVLSVVNQKTKYKYEIVVNDDYSTDGTYSIIRSLQEKYPYLIRIIRNEKNLGLNKSFENAVRNVETEYIAILGGDDYWIILDKIEKQLDILNADSSIALVHTSYKRLIENTGKIIDGGNENWKFPSNSKEKLDKVAVVVMHSWIGGYPSASTSCFRRKPLLMGLDNYPWILNNPLSESGPNPGEGTLIQFSMCMYGGDYHFIEEGAKKCTMIVKDYIEKHYE